MTKDFKRVHNALDIIISSVLIIGGIVTVVIPTSVGVNIVGCCLAFCGIVLFFTTKSGYKDNQSGICFSKKTKYFPASRKAEILEALRNDPSQMDWSEGEIGNGLKVDIYVNKKQDIVFVHCEEYIPYSYQDCSDWFSFKVGQTGNLLK